MMNACARWSFLAVLVIASIDCSDPVPLPAQGAITLSVTTPSQPVPAMMCPVPGKQYLVGSKGNAPTETDPGESLIDGDGATVSCSVHGSGPYTFSGSLHASTTEGDPITVTFTGGTVDADKKTGSVSVNLYTPQLAGNFDSGSTPCTVTVINGQVKNGSIWAQFSCPSVASPPSNLCGIGTSTFVFENCDGS
jgi:hypothetical protein